MNDLFNMPVRHYITLQYAMYSDIDFDEIPNASDIPWGLVERNLLAQVGDGHTYRITDEGRTVARLIRRAIMD
jgi:hypothetical protein